MTGVQSLQKSGRAVVMRKAQRVSRPAHHRHADGDPMAMGHGITAASLHRMAHSVAEIQQLPGALVPLVLTHQFRFDLHALGHNIVHISAMNPLSEGFKQCRGGDHAVFQSFGAAVGKILVGQRIQGGGVAHGQNGLAEGAGQVFAGGQIHSRFASHRAIDGRH